jgi:parallel beta-helix repeat protein
MRKGTTYAIVLIALASVLVLCGNLVSATAKTITVGPSGCDYTSIQAAISAARSGDTVYVQSGTYEEHIVFKEGVILQGAGRDKVTIWYGGNNSVITVRNISSGKIDGFTIEYKGTDERFVIWISSSNLTLSNNVIAGAVYSGILVGDISSDPLIEDNIIINNRQHGIYIRSYAKGTIRDNEIYENGYSGIAVAEEADPLIEDNTIMNNRQAGIYIRSYAKGTIWGNEIYENGYSGIAVKEEAEPLIEDNVIRSNQYNGIFACSSAKGTIRNNEIYENGYSGIEVVEDSEPLIEGNIIRNHEYSGIYIYSSAKGTIRDNEIYENGYPGITVAEDSDPLIQNNTIIFNTGDGIWVSGDSKPVIKNNIIVRNEGDGINVAGYNSGPKGNPIVSYNDVWNNEGTNYGGMSKPITDISVDPQLMDTRNCDFHLKPTSPCIGAGESGEDMGAHPHKKVNQPPVADFSFSPSAPGVGELVRFDASGSSDPDGRIRNYEWAFGDGISGLGRTTTHTYSRNGSYTVRLTVADDDGSTASTTKAIIVTRAAQPSRITSIDFSERIPRGVEAKGMIGFHDPDGDLVRARFEVLEGDLEDFTLDLTKPPYAEQVEGLTEGSFNFEITVDQPGSYHIAVTLVDKKGLTSEPVEFSFGAISPAPPTISSVIFPPAIAVNRAQKGLVKFEDLDGDIVQAEFTVVEGDPAVIMIEPGMNFDPEVSGRTEGAFRFSVQVTQAQTITLRLTLTDSAGQTSEPHEFTFEVE